MKQLEVQIMGQNYLLGCPENSERRLLQAVDQVDSAMCKIRDAGKIKARDRIAVLAALNLTFELLTSETPEPTQATAPEAAVPAPDNIAIVHHTSTQLAALLQRLNTVLDNDTPTH